ncbi:MAG: hypothetical protein WBJ84_05895 [Bacteroidales bacterium]
MDGFAFMSKIMDYRKLLSDTFIKSNQAEKVTEDYLIINTSRNHQLLPQGELLNSVIVDRQQLTRVLEILNQNSDKIKYIVTDIFLEEEDGINDEALSKVITELDRKNKIVLACYYNTEGEYVGPFIDATAGLAQYKSSFLKISFLKLSYIKKDKPKNIALIAYEQSEGKKMDKKRFIGIPYYAIDGHWCLNTVIPAFFYKPSDMFEDESYVHLGYFNEFNIGDGQVVIIGDLEGLRDTHGSIINKVSGPLIILNSIEMLRRGKNIINFWYLVLLLVMFSIITYHTFYRKRIKELRRGKERKIKLFEMVYKNLNYLIILLLSLLSMLVFNFYIHLFILLSYIGLIDYITVKLLKKPSDNLLERIK